MFLRVLEGEEMFLVMLDFPVKMEDFWADMPGGIVSLNSQWT
jgi:hypothetical protein